MNQAYQSESREKFSDQSQQTVITHPQRLSQLAVLAIVSQILLLASAWLLPIASEYRLIGDNISELVLGRYGFVQTIAFLIAGIGTLGLAFAIRKLTTNTRGSFIGSLLIGIYGAGAILEAIFPTDRIDNPADVLSLSATGMLHVTVALASFLCIIVGMFSLAWTFSRQARWRSLLPMAAILPGAALALLIVSGESPWVGIMQRLFITTIAAWLILAALKVRSITAVAAKIQE
jgi:hypothetical protein